MTAKVLLIVRNEPQSDSVLEFLLGKGYQNIRSLSSEHTLRWILRELKTFRPDVVIADWHWNNCNEAEGMSLAERLFYAEAGYKVILLHEFRSIAAERSCSEKASKVLATLIPKWAFRDHLAEAIETAIEY